MATWEPRANELFLRAADVTDPADRAALLERECANDPALRRQVESLLDAGEKAGSFLGRPPPGRWRSSAPTRTAGRGR